MLKHKWVIDANILGNLCRDKNDENQSKEFLDQVKQHRVLMCKEVLNEYKPMAGRRFCDKSDKEYLREWLFELTKKFGISTKLENTPKLPSCIERVSRRFGGTKDSMYVRLALSNHDCLLVASEYHFRTLKDCIEKSGIQMLNEKDALDFIEHKYSS